MTGTAVSRSLVLFTLNEIEGMRVVLPQIRRDWFDELIVVDGGSTDGTIEFAEEQGCHVFVQHQPGLAGAFSEALQVANGEIVAFFTPDGNSVPERVPELFAKMEEGYDIVIVSRYLDGAKSYDDDTVTAFGNWLFTSLTNLFFGTHLTDILVGFRAYRRTVINSVMVEATSNAWASQALIRCHRAGANIGEIPGDEPPRIGGQRKMRPLQNGLAELKVIVEEFLRPWRPPSDE